MGELVSISSTAFQEVPLSLAEDSTEGHPTAVCNILPDDELLSESTQESTAKHLLTVREFNPREGWVAQLQ